MNTSVRARRAVRGFSMVELLVTVILAGIIFAAMVPVFVSAQQKASGDQMRNVALNAAQDHIEKIRQMPFGSIVDSANLDTVLGTTWTAYGASSSKLFHVQHLVTAGPGNPVTYYTVSVRVWWDPPPAPVKEVLLKTIIVDRAVAAVSPTPSASPSASPSPSPSPSPSASPSPSPSPSPTTYPNKKYDLTIATNERYNHKVHLVQTNVVPAVDCGTKTFDGNTAAMWKNLPSGAYRVEHTYGWWDYRTEISAIELLSNLTIRYDNYVSIDPGH